MLTGGPSLVQTVETREKQCQKDVIAVQAAVVVCQLVCHLKSSSKDRLNKETQKYRPTKVPADSADVLPCRAVFSFLVFQKARLMCGVFRCAGFTGSVRSTEAHRLTTSGHM